MSQKRFPSELSELLVPVLSDKLMIHDLSTGQTMWCTVAELFAALLSGAATFNSSVSATQFNASTSMKIGITISTTYGQFVLVQSTVAAPSFVRGIQVVHPSGTVDAGGYISMSMTGTNEGAIQVGTDNLSGVLKLNPSGGQVKIPSTTPSTSSTTGALVVSGGVGIADGIWLGNDNAHKPGTGGLWTVVSDIRIKKDIELADLDRCYEIVKSTPLKRYGYADGIYSDEQVKDRHSLGWIAQDVQKVFPQAVSEFKFEKAEKLPDGFEEYQEQEFEMVDKETVSIEMVDGKPVQVKKVIQEKVMLSDELPVLDESGNPVIEKIETGKDEEGNPIFEDKPLTYSVPRMKTLQREKFKHETIDDCLDLNSGQLYAAMYGALQCAMKKIEVLEAKLANI
jgi:hypothetical protein